VSTATQAEFARLLGVQKSYVSKLKDQGRLVFADDGRVDVEASKQRIQQTSDPNRDDVSQRFDKASSSSGSQRQNGDIGNSYQAARAVKEKYSAMQAKLDYEKAIGKVVDKADVQAVVEDVITQFRQGLENLPYRLAPELVGLDLDGIRAALKQEVFDSLAKMQRGFLRQMEEIGKQEG